jgi:TonB family protein
VEVTDLIGAGRATHRVSFSQSLLRFICERGFEHHVAANLSDDAGHEATTRYLGWDNVPASKQHLKSLVWPTALRLPPSHYLRYFKLPAAPADASNGEECIPMGRIALLCGATALVALALTQPSLTQTGMTLERGHLERKVVSRVAPFYPEIAKRHRIKGVVKLEVVVGKNGIVQSAKALGGSPLLIESAAYAVRQWRFAPALKETSEVIEFEFDYANRE